MKKVVLEEEKKHDQRKEEELTSCKYYSNCLFNGQ